MNKLSCSWAKPYEVFHGDLLVSDNRDLLDRNLIHRFLSTRSYWAQGISREVVDRSIDNSLSFGIYINGVQAGFMRAITDGSTFAWLADVFIVEEKRGQGLGKLLVGLALEHPALAGLRLVLLGTRDAHRLYSQFGFDRPKHIDRYMEIRRPIQEGVEAIPCQKISDVEDAGHGELC